MKLPVASPLTLQDPTIMLGSYVIIGGKHVNEIRPKRATIRDGVVIVDELQLIIPLSTVTLIRKTP